MYKGRDSALAVAGGSLVKRLEIILVVYVVSEHSLLPIG